jgi:hypothetical protein
MHFDPTRRWLVGGLALAVLAGLCSGPAALAQRKGGGGTPPPPAPGTIYFLGWVATSGNDGYYTPMTMNGDGTNKRPALSTSSPSYQPHGNSRWFLLEDYDWDGPVDEWGVPLAWELYAVNEQNQWIQLTGDATIHVSQLGSPSWGKDDSFVSYPAWWFTTENSTEVKGGLFVVAIDWSTGVPIAGAPTLLFEADAYWFGRWDGNVNIDEHDWSPNGSAVVFHQEDSTTPAGTYIADFAGGAAQIRALTTGYDAQWSPDGSRIAYSVSEIWTIRPDGTNATRITQHTITKTEERSQGSPTWSPDGAFLAYTEAVTAKGKTSYSVKRIALSSGSIVNLTSDLAKAGGPKWRP